MEKRPICYSAIQPSGTFTIGNYFGALQNWVKLQEDYDCLFCVANLHALTVPIKPSVLRQNTYSAYATLLALGLDPKESIVYVQSQVPAHTELTWLLNCTTYMGELSRMTQYKDKSRKQGENIRVGLFDYPVLMAADILLYQSNIVPVGIDQKQHVELSRDIAQRFNHQYGETFTLPEPYLGVSGKKIKSLSEPDKKMSKSDDNQNAYVSLLDDKDTIIRKFKRAVTDSEMKIYYDPEQKPGISNLIEIFSLTSGKDYDRIAKDFEGKGYGDFKLAVGESVADHLAEFQRKYKEYLADKKELDNLMKENAERASYLANKTLRKAMKRMGVLI